MSRDRESKRPGTGPAQGRPAGVAGLPLSAAAAAAAGAMGQDGAPLAPGLWLVATPIGNLGDITLRAISVLARAEVLAAEDTRRLRLLLDQIGVAPGGRRLISYHDRNGAERRPEILALLRDGRSVAYTSDAGTPLIADPGYRLVTEARAAGARVHAVPGASAVLAALTLAGLPTDRFLFAGFLPPKQAARRRVAEDLGAVRASLVAFETGPRLAASLADLAAVLGPDRPATVLREITKLHEEVRTGTLGQLAAETAAAAPPKGEIVLVVGPPDAAERAAEAEAGLEGALAAALETMSVKSAAQQVADDLGLPRRQVYEAALKMTGKR